jgi:large subunit ribosomal protein L21
MATFAIIQTGGKQYRVSPGQKIRIEKLAEKVAGDSVSFDKVLLTSDGAKVAVGAPHLEGAAVTGTILRQARDKKKIIYKFHSKNRYDKKKGHRQHFTEVEIKSL